VTLFHQCDEALVTAERVEDAVDLEINHPQ
jgi:hypothetical protein